VRTSFGRISALISAGALAAGSLATVPGLVVAQSPGDASAPTAGSETVHRETTTGRIVQFKSLPTRAADRTGRTPYVAPRVPDRFLAKGSRPAPGSRRGAAIPPQLPNGRTGPSLQGAAATATSSTASRTPTRGSTATDSSFVGGPLLATRQSGFSGIDEHTVVPDGCSPFTAPCIEPPDPWVGVGPNHVVQAVNTIIRVTNRTGTSSTADRDFATFFGEPASQVADADPRVTYDPAKGRWLASALSFDCTAGHLYLGVSATNDPTGLWTIFTFDYAGSIPDYPAFGTSSDKIVLSVNQYPIVASGASCDADGSSFTGASLRVVDWADAIDGDATVTSSVIGPTAARSTWRPGFALGAGIGTSVYLVGMGGTGHVVYTTITGTNHDLNVAKASDRDLTTASVPVQPPGFVAPPQPFQVGGGQIAEALDGRPTDAIWSGGHLYVVSTYACSLDGILVYDCPRVTDLNTASNGDPAQDVVYFADGFDSYMGGIGVAGDGTLHLVFTRSNEFAIPSTWDVARAPTDAPDTLRDERQLKTGSASYAGNRWGDYVGVASDPSDTHSVWQADEYPTSNHSWATWVSKVTLATIGGHDVTRLAGSNRYATAAAVSAATFPTNVDVAYVATGVNFPDALAGGPAAAYQNAPLLLVTASAVPSPTATELTRLQPKKIVVLGSAGVISDAVKTSLQSFTTTQTAGSVVRLAGSNRYATAAAISHDAFQPGVDLVLVAIGSNFPDALAGAAASARVDSPLLLVTATSIPTATSTELARLRPVYIGVLGNGISSSVQASLAQYTAYNSSDYVFREAGPDRYATAALTVADFFDPGVPVVYIATGTNFPDALAAGPAAGIEGSPVLLVTPTSIPTSVKNDLLALQPHRIVVLGGVSSVSDGVKTALAAYLGP
jgi:putative cell wall-binding protein